MQDNKEKKRYRYTPIQIIVLGFIFVIAFGAFLLALPYFNNRPISMLDAYFTSTSAVCVTGHTTVNILEQFNMGGHIVLMLLMEIGGIGFVSFMALILLILKKKITLSDRFLISQSFNTEHLSGLIIMVKRVIIFAGIIQLAGACVLLFEFIPFYGIGKGIFNAIFCSISFFCNAGFDITNVGGQHLFQASSIFTIVGILLTILGGIGFIVWNDIGNVIRKKRENNLSTGRMIKSFSLHTKLVLIMTIMLLIIGTIGIYCFEKNNTQTIGNMNASNKVLVSIFHATTSRSTGIATISLAELNDVTKLLCIFLMVIGGGSGGTAGGIKLSTLAVMILTCISGMLNRKDVVVFNRKISNETIRKAFTVFTTYLFIITVAITAMALIEKNCNIMDVGIETVSALGNVGFSTGITSSLTTFSKLLLMILMYIGRVGTVTMAFAFLKVRGKKMSRIDYPEGKVVIG